MVRCLMRKTARTSVRNSNVDPASVNDPDWFATAMLQPVQTFCPTAVVSVALQHLIQNIAVFRQQQLREAADPQYMVTGFGTPVLDDGGEGIQHRLIGVADGFILRFYQAAQSRSVFQRNIHQNGGDAITVLSQEHDALGCVFCFQQVE